MRRPNDFGGRVQCDPYFTYSLGIEHSKSAWVGRHGIGCVIGAGARSFEARDIGEISDLARRLECSNEVGKLIAISRQDRRARRSLRNESPRHHDEKLCADNSLDHGKPRPQRFDQAHDHIVAVDCKAPRRRSGAFGGDAARDRLQRVKQCPRKASFERRGYVRGHAADARDAAVRILPATAAWSRNVGQSGMSLSHSIKVAIGPTRLMTCL